MRSRSGSAAIVLSPVSEGGDGCVKVDDFNRTVSPGLGASPIEAVDGYPVVWTTAATFAVGSVDAALGAVFPATAAGQFYNYALNFNDGIFSLSAEVEILVRIRLGIGNGTNAPPSLTIEARQPFVFADFGLFKVDSDTVRLDLFGDNYSRSGTVTFDVPHTTTDLWVRLGWLPLAGVHARVWADGTTEPTAWTLTLPAGTAPNPNRPPSAFRVYAGGYPTTGTSYIRRYEITKGFSCGEFSLMGTGTLQRYVDDKEVNHSGDPTYTSLGGSAFASMYQSRTEFRKTDGAITDHQTSYGAGDPQEQFSDIVPSILGNPIYSPTSYNLSKTIMNLTLGPTAIRAKVDYVPANSTGVAVEERPTAFGSWYEAGAIPPKVALYSFRPTIPATNGDPNYGPPAILAPYRIVEAGQWFSLVGTGGIIQLAPWGIAAQGLDGRPHHPYVQPSDEAFVQFRTLDDYGRDIPGSPGTDQYVITVEFRAVGSVWTPMDIEAPPTTVPHVAVRACGGRRAT